MTLAAPPRNDDQVQLAVQDELVKAEIHGRSVVLAGEVRGDFERQSARDAVARVTGVEDVTSMITLRVRPSARDALQRLSDALLRSASIDAGRIRAHLDGTWLTLGGTVSGWPERRAAERAAWSSPSITSLQNDLVVTSHSHPAPPPSRYSN